MTHAIVIGQSHCVAIHQALSTQRRQVRGVSVYRLESKNRPYEPDTISARDAVSIVKNSPSDARVFLSIFGTYHNIWGLLRSGPEFDFFLDQEDPPDPDARVRIPHRAVAGAFERHLSKPGFLQRMEKTASSPLYLLSTPPPKGDNDYMLERLTSQKKRSYRGRDVAEIGVERPLSRLKLWQMETRAITRWAASEGMEFVAAPQEALDGSGFLHSAFYSDATHANEHYGALVVDQICAIVEGRQLANG